jgi:hypothetical protein
MHRSGLFVSNHFSSHLSQQHLSLQNKYQGAGGGGNPDKGPARNPMGKKLRPGSPGRGRGDDDRGGGRGRVSLRLGMGKRGRQNEVRNRRGSLRKKDRSREKAEKEERALERRTVQLPG